MRSIPVFLLICYSIAAPADVLYDHDNGPLTGIFGFPDSTEGARLVAHGSSAWGVAYGVASHSINQSIGEEQLYLDGETSRFELRYRYGIRERVEIGIELPWIQHEAGRLDGFIDNWHNWFKLPEGQRPDRQNDILDFNYSDGSGANVDLTRRASGLGDLRLFAGWQIYDGARHDLALRFSIKFGTADADALLGSGNTDFSFGIAGDVDSLFGVDRLNAFYRASVVRVGQPHYLADRYREWAGHVSLGAGFELTERIELRLQGATRSALYDSELSNIGGNSTTVTFGGNIKLTDRYQLSLAVGEDADVTTAPDVSFMLALRYRAD